MEIHKRGKDTEEKTGNSRVFLIRQILNVIFMIGAVAGGLLYWFMPEPTLGILVIMTSMFFKMAECVLRFRK